MLDFIGLIITTALMVLVVNTLIIFIDASRAAKVTLAAAIGVWIGLAAATAEAGWLSISRPIPVVGLFVAVPLLAAGLATAWPRVRADLCRAVSGAGGRGAAHRPFPIQCRVGRHPHGRCRGARVVAAEGRRGRTPHHGDRGLEPVRCGRSRAGDSLRNHLGRRLAFAVVRWPRLASDAARTLVVRPDGAGSNLAHPACDHRGAAPARQSRPSREGGCLTSQRPRRKRKR